MSTTIVLDHTGDTRFSWDAGNLKEVAKARSMFNELRDAGFSFFTVEGEAKGRRVDEFNPDAAETLIAVPRIVGG